MKKCPYCSAELVPGFALTQHEVTSRVVTLPHDVTAAASLSNYGISGVGDIAKRIVFRSSEDVPSQMSRYIRFSDEDGPSSVDGRTANFSAQGYTDFPITSIACSACHLILPKAQKARNVVLLSDRNGSKTNLTLSLYVRLRESGSNVIAEPAFRAYYQHLAGELLHGQHPSAPPPTHGSVTPYLSVSIGSTEVDFTDTAGEIMGRSSQDTAAPESLDYSPVLNADILIVLISSDDTERNSLSRLNSYLEGLKQLITEPKKVILCFSKCDLYKDLAASYMLTDKENWRGDFRSLMHLRNARFQMEGSAFLSGAFYSVPHPNDERLLQLLRTNCAAISGGTTQFLCVAPLGCKTSSNDGRVLLEEPYYKPLYIDDLIETIRIYGGIS